MDAKTPANIDFKIKGKKLIMTIDLETTIGDTKSGKHRAIATTFGDYSLLSKGDSGTHTGIKLNLNVYRHHKPDEK